MKTALALACAIVALVQVSIAQVSTFQSSFGYTGGNGLWLDNAGDVRQLLDSNIIVLSFSTGIDAGRGRVIINKFSPTGEQIFENDYGKDSTFYAIGQAGTMVRSYDGGFIVAGQGGKNGIDTWAALWKFNIDGDSIFERNYGSLGESDSIEILYAVAELPDSGLALVGVSGLNQDSFPISELNPNLYLIRTDKNGYPLWKKTYDRSFDDEGLHIAMFDSSHLIIAGYKHAYNSAVGTPWVFVTDLYGNITKEKSFPDPPYNCWQLIGPHLFKAIDQNFLFVGCLNGALQNGFYDYPLYTAKMDTSLNFIWEHDFNSANIIGAYSAHQNPDSSIMAVGAQVDSNNGRIWGWLSKLDNDGNVIWDKLYKHGSSFTNYLFDIDQTYDCGFVVSGSTIVQGDQQSWLMKTDRFGCIDPVCDSLPGSCAGIPTTADQWFDVSLITLDAKLYPNPCNDELNIFYNLPEKSNSALFQIFNINGRKIFERTLSRGTHLSKMDASQWTSGVYVCILKTEEQVFIREILVGR